MSGTNTNSASNIPHWVEEHLFNTVLRESGQDVKEICEFKVFPALAPGENYASTMLKVELVVKLNDGSSNTQTFMLKVPNKNQHLQEQWDAWQLFETETQMYEKVIPQIERVYRNAGKQVRFGAHSYRLNTKERHIVLEDLTRSGFKTLKRLDGLDMEHCRSVICKMAQWHAASAVCKELHPTLTTKRGILNENAKELLNVLFNDSIKNILKAVRKLPHYMDYYEKLENLSCDFAEKLRVIYQADEEEFNVLNHGDCWSNNIMFQYDEVGRIQSTYFVDLQVPLYGSPAMDLYYFIFSSAKLELKVERFDEMIQFYHEKLVENLILLKYEQKLPSLRSIHQMLLKYGIWGILTISSIMAGVLCEPTETANIDNLTRESEEGEQFKNLMYFNERYLKHLDVIVPWLNNRGAFDY
ncbi:uncharacterized protein [Musca autumnalis]|uniref:uncharacterized protein n=1 Tax=Musca autumnalis TaxID=221902 RepID=UPI003CF14F57